MPNSLKFLDAKISDIKVDPIQYTLKEEILAERKFGGFGGFGQNPPN